MDNIQIDKNLVVFIIAIVAAMIIFGYCLLCKKIKNKPMALLGIIGAMVPLLIWGTKYASIIMGSPAVCCGPEDVSELLAEAAKPFYVQTTQNSFIAYSYIVRAIGISLAASIIKDVLTKRWDDLKSHIFPGAMFLCNLGGLLFWQNEIKYLETDINSYYFFGDAGDATTSVAIWCSWVVEGVLAVTTIFLFVKLLKKKRNKKDGSPAHIEKTSKI